MCRGRRARGLRTFAVALVVAVAGALAGGAAAQAAPLSWSGPLAVDHHPPFAAPMMFTGISCPDSGHCAAVAYNGIDVSTNPTGGYTAWQRVPVGAGAISCPSTGLCVAGGYGGFSTSTAPFGGGAWTALSVDGTNTVDGISCPTTGFCAAVDGSGNVLTTTTPTVGSSWHVANVDPGEYLASISCPTTGFCAFVDQSGQVFTSSNPTGGVGAWSKRPVDSGGLTSISCPTSTLCVAAGINDDKIATSTNPSGGASAWTLGSPGAFGNPTGGLGGLAVDCASTSLCVLVAGSNVVTTTAPAGGASAWQVKTIAAEQGAMDAVSCPVNTTFCAAADSTGGGPGFPTAYSGGDVLTTTNPSGPGSAWSIQQVDGDNFPVSVNCSNPTYCIVGDNAGSVVTSANPAGGAGTWSFAHIDPDGANGGPGSAGPPTLTAAACHSSSGCVAGDNAGDLLSTANPLGGASAWHVFTGVAQYYNQFGAAACPAANECLINDAYDNLAVVNPASTATPTLTNIGWAMSGLSCPSTTLCVGVSGNDIVTSTTPTGGASAWHGTNIDSHTLSGVSCPAANLCVAVDNAGNALWSSTPLSGGWHTVDIDGSTPLTGVACASASLCAAVDNVGHALSSTTPSGAASSWSSTALSSQTLSAVSCSAAPVCVAVGPAGVFVATPAAGGLPAVTTGPARNVTSTRAVLTGTVNPNGQTITGCHFEYGTGGHFTHSVPCEHAVGGGSSPVPVSATVKGLTPGTRYVFKLVIVTASGHIQGATQSFTTSGSGTVRKLAALARAGRSAKYARRRAAVRARRNV